MWYQHYFIKSAIAQVKQCNDGWEIRHFYRPPHGSALQLVHKAWFETEREAMRLLDMYAEATKEIQDYYNGGIYDK